MKYNNKKVIFDFGANNGNDIDYYLEKADIVVAIEADSFHCKAIEKKYKNLLNKRVFIENCVLVDKKNSKKTLFFFSKLHSALSTIVKPQEKDLHNFTSKEIRSTAAADIIFKYTKKPFFIKIDLENYDYFILKALFAKRIYPDFLSVEFHDLRIISLFLSSGVYKSFNYVEGGIVPFKYKNYLIRTKNEFKYFNFQKHSSGPFGDDIRSRWLHSENFFRTIMVNGNGWRDIHASKKIVSKMRNRTVTLFILWSLVVCIYYYLWIKIRSFKWFRI